MAQVIIRPAAENDLDDISDYIAEQSDNERAREVLREIYRKMQLHATQPNAGRRCDELKKGIRSFSVYRYVVFYRPLDDGIIVVRVLHGSRDLEAQDYD
ncbi:MAG: type II toxin-antitoxin system RelE/ParE family toxin [Chloroflexota bacterium]|jgi:toxin ParE1/3/4